MGPSKVGMIENFSNFTLGVAGTACATGLLGGLYKQVSPLQSGFDSTSAAIFGGSLYAINSVLVKFTDAIANNCCSKPKVKKEQKNSGIPQVLNPQTSSGKATSTLWGLTRFGISAAAAYKFTEFVAEKLNAPIRHTAQDGAILSLGVAATVVGATIYAKLANQVEAQGGPVKVVTGTASAIKKSIDDYQEKRADAKRVQQEVKQKEQRKEIRAEENERKKIENKALRKDGQPTKPYAPDSDDGEPHFKGDTRTHTERRRHKAEKKADRKEMETAARHARNAVRKERHDAGEQNIENYSEDEDGRVRGKNGEIIY